MSLAVVTAPILNSDVDEVAARIVAGGFVTTDVYNEVEARTLTNLLRTIGLRVEADDTLTPAPLTPSIVETGVAPLETSPGLPAFSVRRRSLDPSRAKVLRQRGQRSPAPPAPQPARAAPTVATDEWPPILVGGLITFGVGVAAWIGLAVWYVLS